MLAAMMTSIVVDGVSTHAVAVIFKVMLVIHTDKFYLFHQ